MDQAKNIQAVFGTVVGTNAIGGGRIVLNLPNPVTYATALTASAVPNPGNQFLTWSGVATGTNAPTTIQITNATPTVGALFAALPANKHSLAVVVVGNGAVAVNPQNHYYNPGDTVTLSASASDEITAFNGWTGSAAGTGNPLTLTVNSNMVVQAHFVGIKILSAPSNLTVNAGDSATFSVTAAGTAPLAYQWYKDGVAIQGATDTNFTIASALAGDAGYYRLVITNMTGSLTSSVAVLTALAQNQKLLTDPGFELGGAAWSGSILRGGTGTVVTDAAVAHSGSNYFSAGPVGWASVVQGDAAGAYGTGVSLPITATDYYQLQAWVKVPGASTKRNTWWAGKG